MRKQYIFLLSIFFFVSCSVIKESDVIGCYEFRWGGNRSLLELKTDYTYLDESRGHLVDFIQRGKWHLRGKTVILNSYIQPHTKGRFEEKNNGEHNGEIKFYMRDFVTQELDTIFEQVEITIGDSVKNLFKIEKGIFILKSQINLEKSFVVNVFPFYKDLKVKPKMKDSNVFDLYLVNCHRSYDTNEKLIYNNNNLVFRKSVILKKVNCK